MCYIEQRLTKDNRKNKRELNLLKRAEKREKLRAKKERRKLAA